jgi:hypothetical protein
VAEGQAKVDGERNQRKPGTIPDLFPKPAHRMSGKAPEPEGDIQF